MSGIVGLHHVQLCAPSGSEERSREFYGNALDDPHGNRIELLERISP